MRVENSVGLHDQSCSIVDVRLGGSSKALACPLLACCHLSLFHNMSGADWAHCCLHHAWPSLLFSLREACLPAYPSPSARLGFWQQRRNPTSSDLTRLLEAYYLGLADRRLESFCHWSCCLRPPPVPPPIWPTAPLSCQALPLKRCDATTGQGNRLGCKWLTDLWSDLGLLFRTGNALTCDTSHEMPEQ